MFVCTICGVIIILLNVRALLEEIFSYTIYVLFYSKQFLSIFCLVLFINTEYIDNMRLYTHDDNLFSVCLFIHILYTFYIVSIKHTFLNDNPHMGYEGYDDILN